MKTYIVHVSDSCKVDRQTPVMVCEGTSIGKVAQMAVDEFMQANDGGVIEFPLFLDIHLSEEHAGVAPLYIAKHPSA